MPRESPLPPARRIADDPGVAPPSGLGSNVFKDRGAIDRADFFAPTAILANPEDNSVNDLDPDQNEVWIDLPEDPEERLAKATETQEQVHAYIAANFAT